MELSSNKKSCVPGLLSIMHLSMVSPRGVGWRDYHRELDNFENLGLVSYPCDTIHLDVHSNLEIISSRFSS